MLPMLVTVTHLLNSNFLPNAWCVPRALASGEKSHHPVFSMKNLSWIIWLVVSTPWKILVNNTKSSSLMWKSTYYIYIYSIYIYTYDIYIYTYIHMWETQCRKPWLVMVSSFPSKCCLFDGKHPTHPTHPTHQRHLTPLPERPAPLASLKKFMCKSNLCGEFLAEWKLLTQRICFCRKKYGVWPSNIGISVPLVWQFQQENLVLTFVPAETHTNPARSVLSTNGWFWAKIWANQNDHKRCFPQS